MNICTDDDEEIDEEQEDAEQEDDCGILRIGNLILCSREEWLRRKLLTLGPRISASTLAILDPPPRSSGMGAG